jgi:hypothetical protein
VAVDEERAEEFAVPSIGVEFSGGMDSLHVVLL